MYQKILLFFLTKYVLEFGGMTVNMYQKFVKFRALNAGVRMGGYCTAHQLVFVENVWEYQLHFGVMFGDETLQERNNRRQENNLNIQSRKTQNLRRKSTNYRQIKI